MDEEPTWGHKELNELRPDAVGLSTRLHHWRSRDWLPSASGSGNPVRYSANEFAVAIVLIDNVSAQGSTTFGGDLLERIIAEIKRADVGAGTVKASLGNFTATVRLTWPPGIG